jgi:hypothetical protein
MTTTDILTNLDDGFEAMVLREDGLRFTTYGDIETAGDALPVGFGCMSGPLRHRELADAFASLHGCLDAHL